MMTLSPPAIATSGLAKSYGEIEAVRGVDLTVRPGEMFAIVGPDGAGKTTTIRMLCGIVKPTGGSMTILGFDGDEQRDLITPKIGYLSQKFSLYGDLTIDENIEYFAEIHDVSDFRARRDELLEFTRLKPFRTRLAEKLSGGMKQKLALACTLVHSPEIIFLDEPTTGVDPVSRRDFWSILSSLLRSGITIFMATPYLDEAERCSSVALFDNGRILVADTPAAIKRQMHGTIVEVVCDRVRDGSNILRKSGKFIDVQAFGDRLNVVVEERGETARGAIVSLLADAGIAIGDIRPVAPSLENVFISMVSRGATS